MADNQTRVTAEEFRENWDHFVKVAQNGHGPIAVVEKRKVVGYFVGTRDFETLFDVEVAKMPEDRTRETKTVPHGVTRALANATIKKKVGRAPKKSGPDRTDSELEHPALIALLDERFQGKTISHEAAKARIQAVLDQGARLHASKKKKNR